MSDKVLIIGGAGFVGINLAKFLVKNRSYEITLADCNFTRDMTAYFSQEELKNLKIISSDLTLRKSFENFDLDYKYVYMLASVVGVNNTLEMPEEVIRINTSLIMNCLDWLTGASVKRVVFSSTSETYSGSTELLSDIIPTDETVPLCIKDVSDPRFTYAITKILGESAFLTYSRKYDFEVTIVRYHNAFGPDMGFKHVIPHLVERFINKENPFRMYGCEQTRAFSYIENTVEGTVLAMETCEAAGEIIHIGDSDEITIEELIKTVGEIMGFEGKYVPAKTYPGSVSRRCPDITKAQNLLSYQPKVDWRSGLEETVSWYSDYFKANKVARSDGFKEQEKFE